MLDTNNTWQKKKIRNMLTCVKSIRVIEPLYVLKKNILTI